MLGRDDRRGKSAEEINNKHTIESYLLGKEYIKV
jgi:hypothetical protein